MAPKHPCLSAADRERTRGKTNDAKQKNVSIEGGGHVVPNPYKKAAFLLGKTATQVNSAELVWDFFHQQNQE
jgi:poly(3-hydroxybutyrate) depolymerase